MSILYKKAGIIGDIKQRARSFADRHINQAVSVVDDSHVAEMRRSARIAEKDRARKAGKDTERREVKDFLRRSAKDDIRRENKRHQAEAANRSRSTRNKVIGIGLGAAALGTGAYAMKKHYDRTREEK